MRITDMKERCRITWNSLILREDAQEAMTEYENRITDFILGLDQMGELPAKYRDWTLGEIRDEMPHPRSLEELKAALTECHSAAQARRLIKGCGFHIEGDDSRLVGCLSLWLTDNVRVWHDKRMRAYKVQIWH